MKEDLQIYSVSEKVKVNDYAVMVYQFPAWFFYLVFIALVPLFSPALWHKSKLCHLLTASITKNLKPQQKLRELGWFHSSSLQTKRSFLLQIVSVHKYKKIESFKINLHCKRSCIQIVFRVTSLWVKCYVPATVFGYAMFNRLVFYACSVCVFYTSELCGFSIEMWF